MNIEIQGVSRVKLAISKSDFLVPHINDTDKEPSWDGDVEVYRKAGDNHSKADLILKVPVQIKGHKANNLKKDKIKFKVECADMKNYLEIGGTIFFVVYFDESGENYRIYYTEFLPYNLKKILRGQERKKTKTVELKSFPTSKSDISDVFIKFARNMQRQRSAIYAEDISLIDLTKSGEMPALSFSVFNQPGKTTSAIEKILEGNMYVYAKMSHGLELPVAYIDTVEMAGRTAFADISVGEKQYYDRFEIIYRNDTIEWLFGKSTHIIANRKDETTIRVNFSLSGTLSDRIHDETFLLDALTEKKICIDNEIIDLFSDVEESSSTFNIPQIIEHLEWLRTVKRMLDSLDVKKELECSALSRKDEENIRFLKTAIIDETPIQLKESGGGFGFFSIANLDILVWAIKKEDNGFSILNFNDASFDAKIKGTDGLLYLSSFYVTLKRDVILRSCNLNFEKMLSHLKKVPFSEIYSSQVILLLLELLSAYDDSTPKRNDIIIAATEISAWLKENDPYTPKEILNLNYFQTVKRQRPFEEDEFQELLSIIEGKPDREEIYVAAYLLMDNQEAANSHYKLLTDENQNTLREYPIFHFWKE